MRLLKYIIDCYIFNMNIIRKFWILYNRIYFTMCKISYGKYIRVCNKLYLNLKGDNKISIGDGFTFSSGGYNPLSRNIKGSIEMEKGASLEIGDNVGISSSCLWVYDYLKIGDNTKIGADTIILDSDAHSLDFRIRMTADDRKNCAKKGINIGNNVLVGTRCIILKGVTIGDRAIIGSGSVVTKSIPADCIAAGNPCKVIKYINIADSANV